jgi:hypothetical protein
MDTGKKAVMLSRSARVRVAQTTGVMTHDISLIATIAVSLALAFGLGFLAHRLRLPPLIG